MEMNLLEPEVEAVRLQSKDNEPVAEDNNATDEDVDDKDAATGVDCPCSVEPFSSC